MTGTLIQILLAIAGLLGLGGLFMRNQANQRKAGRDAEHSRQADAAAETQRRVDQATAAVDRLGDDAVRDRLRQRWGGATPGPGAPVQPRAPDRDAG